MFLSIGTSIKELRTKHKVTQEQLATFLGVTSQAVSRWESGAVYPDIEMIPSIAGYFEVSTDYLLGVNRDEREKRRDEIHLEIAKGNEIDYCGEEAINAARGYLAEFPSDETIQLNLAHTICRTFMWDEAPNLDRLAEAEKLYQTVIDTTSDNSFRYDAMKELATLYAVAYRDEHKVRYVLSQFPTMDNSRECVGALVSEYSGLWIGRIQDYIEKLTDQLCITLREYIIKMPNGPETWDEKIAMFERLISIYTFVFGENLLNYHSRVAVLYRVIATYRVAQNRYDDTIRCLVKMVYHVKEADKVRPGDRYASPFMDTMEYPEQIVRPDEYCPLILHNEAWYILNDKLTQDRYDPIRETDGFRAVVEELSSIAK